VETSTISEGNDNRPNVRSVHVVNSKLLDCSLLEITPQRLPISKIISVEPPWLLPHLVHLQPLWRAAPSGVGPSAASLAGVAPNSP